VSLQRFDYAPFASLRFYREGEEQKPVLDWPLLGRRARLKNEFHLLEHSGA